MLGLVRPGEGRGRLRRADAEGVSRLRRGLQGQRRTCCASWLEGNAPNVHPVGRNGMHKYNNQDHSMFTAMLTVENILGAAPRHLGRQRRGGVPRDRAVHAEGAVGARRGRHRPRRPGDPPQRLQRRPPAQRAQGLTPHHGGIAGDRRAARDGLGRGPAPHPRRWPGATWPTSKPAAPRCTRPRSQRRWAEAGIEVTVRTSYAQGHPPEGTRDGYRVIRKHGRFMVFPTTVLSEVARAAPGPATAWSRSGTARPYLSPLWARCPHITLVHHVHKDMWRLVLEEKLRPLRRVHRAPGRPAVLPQHPDRHAVRVVPPGAHRLPAVQARADQRGAAGHRRPLHPRRAPQPDAADRRRRPAHGRPSASTSSSASWPTLRDRHPDLQLVIVGDGYERLALEDQIAEIDADRWVRLAGHVSEEELLALYRQAWVVASASIAEGWGMTLTEAAACGTPAVATRHQRPHRLRARRQERPARRRLPRARPAARPVLTDEGLRRQLSEGALRLGRRPSPGMPPPSACSRPLAREAIEAAATGSRAPRRRDRHDGVDGPQPPRPLGHGSAGWITVVVPTLLTFVPLLLTAPGVVGADTKTYLYLDPGKLLAEAPYVWDSQIGMGIGHPPEHRLPVADGAVLLALRRARACPTGSPSASGSAPSSSPPASACATCCRTLGWAARPPARRRRRARRHRSPTCSAPTCSNYSARISVILLPWAALPWLIALTARSIRQGGWRYPALFALVDADRRRHQRHRAHPGRRSARCSGSSTRSGSTARSRCARRSPPSAASALLTLVTSLWWIVGPVGRGPLRAARHPLHRDLPHGRHRLVARPRCCAGLGYWFFYGNDKLGPWIEPSVDLHARTWPCSRSATPSRSSPSWPPPSCAGATGRCSSPDRRGRRAHRRRRPPVVDTRRWSASVFKAFTRTDAGLSLRSTPRAVPLVVLGFAVFLGAGGRRPSGAASPAWPCPSTVLAALAARRQPPARCGPARWWRQPAAPRGHPRRTGSRPPTTSTPGTPTPGCSRCPAPTSPATGGATRSTRSRRASWTAATSPASCSSTARPSRPTCSTRSTAASRRARSTPRAIAPIARVMAAGDVVVRSDLQYERYRTPRPRDMWDVLLATPGLGPVLRFGDPVPNIAGPEQPLIDEIELGTDPNRPDPPPVAAFNVPAAGADRAHPHGHRLAADGRRRRGPGRRGRRRADRRPTRASFYSASLRRRPDRLRRDLRRRRRPPRHRHQPPASRAVGHDPRAFGLHRAGRRGRAVRPDRPAPRRLPRTRPQADQTVSEQRGGVGRDRHGLRQPDHLHPRRPAGQRPRRRPDQLVAGRRHRRPGRRAARHRHRPRRSPPTTSSCCSRSTCSATAGSPSARLHFDDRPPVDVDLDRRVADRAGPDRHVPRADVPPPRDRGPRHQRRARGPATTAVSGVGLRRGRHRRRPGRRADPPADRPARPGRRVLDRPPPRRSSSPGCGPTRPSRCASTRSRA